MTNNPQMGVVGFMCSILKCWGPSRLWNGKARHFKLGMQVDTADYRCTKNPTVWLTLRTWSDTEEKMLQPNAFAYDN